MIFYKCPDCKRAQLPYEMMIVHMVTAHGWLYEFAGRFLVETEGVLR